MHDCETEVGDLLIRVHGVINELATEFVRRGDQCIGKNPTSQESACFLLSLRATSLLLGMGLLLKPSTRDSWDVLSRSFLEARDLLITFRFDDHGIRNSIKVWYEGKTESSWKPRHKKCEEFVKRIGAGDTELAKRWSAFSALTHPTVHAAKNSTALAVSWVTGRLKTESFEETMEPKIADYLVSVSTLIVSTTFDFPQWVTLGCDMARMPLVEPFRLEVAKVTAPIMARNNKINLPPGSYRSK